VPIYKDFAHLYNMGWYSNFSFAIAEIFPELLDYLGYQPKSILDLACGTGTFAIEIAKLGIETTGVDISSRMLSIAKKKAKEEKVSIRWLHQDMMNLKLNQKVDMCTCWFDSLNYMLERDDLSVVFQKVQNALQPGGYFIFDMNTIYGLIENWNRFPSYVPQDNAKCFEVHQPSYDYETNIASMKITGFIKEGDAWKRIQEIHREKAYTLQEIRETFREAGFKEIKSFDNLQEKIPIEKESKRVFFILRNQS
jgi:ubiquinone/menaquinone biosynthesis C-methylase UbiE